MENKDYWKTIYFISSLMGPSYVVKRVFITDWGASSVKDSKRRWEVNEGEVLILGKDEDIMEIPDNQSMELNCLLKRVHLLLRDNKAFVIGNDFYYPSGIEDYIEEGVVIPTRLNNVIYCGDSNDVLGVMTREVYNYVMFNDLEVREEDRDEVVKRVRKREGRI